MIRLIALDLDRTTLRLDKTLSPVTEKALNKAAASGIEIVIASGRPFSALPPQIFSVKGIRYAITSNGAAVCSFPDGKRIAATLLPEKAVRHILDLFPEMQCFEVLIGGKAYAWEPYIADPMKYGSTATAVSYIQTTRIKVADMRSFAYLHAQELDSLDMIVKSSLAQERNTQLLREQVPDVYVTSSVRGLIEISGTLHGKGDGPRRLSSLLNIRPEEMMAFGDAHNDLDMMRYAGVSVAVANASEEVRNAADLVTASCEEDGVAMTIQQLLNGSFHMIEKGL